MLSNEGTFRFREGATGSPKNSGTDPYETFDVHGAIENLRKHYMNTLRHLIAHQVTSDDFEHELSNVLTIAESSKKNAFTYYRTLHMRLLDEYRKCNTECKPGSREDNETLTVDTHALSQMTSAFVHDSTTGSILVKSHRKGKRDPQWSVPVQPNFRVADRKDGTLSPGISLLEKELAKLPTDQEKLWGFVRYADAPPFDISCEDVFVMGQLIFARRPDMPYITIGNFFTCNGNLDYRFYRLSFEANHPQIIRLKNVRFRGRSLQESIDSYKRQISLPTPADTASEEGKETSSLSLPPQLDRLGNWARGRLEIESPIRRLQPLPDPCLSLHEVIADLESVQQRFTSTFQNGPQAFHVVADEVFQHYRPFLQEFFQSVSTEDRLEEVTELCFRLLRILDRTGTYRKLFEYIITSEARTPTADSNGQEETTTVEGKLDALKAMKLERERTIESRTDITEKQRQRMLEQLDTSFREDYLRVAGMPFVEPTSGRSAAEYPKSSRI